MKDTADGALGPDTLPQIIASGTVLELSEGQCLGRSINNSVAYFDGKPIAYVSLKCLGVGGLVRCFTCTIQLASVKKDTNFTVVQDLGYDPGLLGTNMNKETFSDSFGNLAEVVVTPASEHLIDASTAIVIDCHTSDAYLK